MLLTDRVDKSLNNWMDHPVLKEPAKRMHCNGKQSDCSSYNNALRIWYILSMSQFNHQRHGAKRFFKSDMSWQYSQVVSATYRCALLGIQIPNT